MSKDQKKKNPLQHVIAGGCAGFIESSVCHPLDTIKTRMQLRRQTQTLEAVRARSSFVEPALRLKNSLTEPALRLKHSLAEPFALISRGAKWAEPATATTEGVIGGVLSKPGVHEPGLKLASTATIQYASPPLLPKYPINRKGTVTAPLGPFGTARRIIKREGFRSLYKGLTAVYTGIVPKMAIRFLSFEEYKQALAKISGNTGSSTIFLAGLASGLTEAVLVVTVSRES